MQQERPFSIHATVEKREENTDSPSSVFLARSSDPHGQERPATGGLHSLLLRSALAPATDTQCLQAP